MTPTPDIAVLIRGSASEAAITIRGVKSCIGDVRPTIYLVLDSPPAEALNQAAAIRTEQQILFLDAGLSPLHPDWLSRMAERMRRPKVAAVVGGLATTAGQLAGLLVRRDSFELLGGFDAERHPNRGYVEDYLSRLIGIGQECVAAAGVEFLAGSAQLKRAS